MQLAGTVLHTSSHWVPFLRSEFAFSISHFYISFFSFAIFYFRTLDRFARAFEVLKFRILALVNFALSHFAL